MITDILRTAVFCANATNSTDGDVCVTIFCQDKFNRILVAPESHKNNLFRNRPGDEPPSRKQKCVMVEVRRTSTQQRCVCVFRFSPTDYTRLKQTRLDPTSLSLHENFD